MRKIEVGQLMRVNGLDMEEFINWVDDRYKFYPDGSPNYIRPDVEMWIRAKTPMNSKVVVDIGEYVKEKSNS